MGVYLNCSVITRNLKGKLDKNKNPSVSVANPPPRKSRSDACFMSLELAWLEFNKFFLSFSLNAEDDAGEHKVAEAASVVKLVFKGRGRCWRTQSSRSCFR